MLENLLHLLQRAVKDEVCELHGNPALTTRQVAHVTEDALEVVSSLYCLFVFDVHLVNYTSLVRQLFLVEKAAKEWL